MVQQVCTYVNIFFNFFKTALVLFCYCFLCLTKQVKLCLEYSIKCSIKAHSTRSNSARISVCQNNKHFSLMLHCCVCLFFVLNRNYFNGLLMTCAACEACIIFNLYIDWCVWFVMNENKMFFGIGLEIWYCFYFCFVLYTVFIMD